MSWTFFLGTFGCKVNQYESQSLREAWLALGGTETETPAQADWIVLNTCSVTSQAVSDARQSVRRLHRLAPHAGIVITGCSATSSGDEFTALPGVRAVIPQSDKESLLHGPHALAQSALPSSPKSSQAPYPGFTIATFRRARPVLKVQDGCTHHCTYCIVPLMRGPSRSRHPDDVIVEARRLLDAGYREIMLSGINLHQFAIDDGGDFWDLVALLDTALASEWKGSARLRLSSLDPAQLDPRKGSKPFDTLANASLLCPHLHLSLQSGSPETLRRMGRGHYGPEHILAAMDAVKSVWPLFGLGADVLMGFPGETDAQSEETLDLLRALPLTYAHVFPFSPRPGTHAATLPDLPGPLKQARAQAARRIAKEKQLAFCSQLAALPELSVVLDAPHDTDIDPDEQSLPQTQSALKGICEYYVTCVAEADEASPELDLRSIIRARPVHSEGTRIVVSF